MSDRLAELIAAKQEVSPRVKEWLDVKGPKGPGIAESFSRGVSGASSLILQSATVPRRMLTAAAEMFGLSEGEVGRLDALARIASPGNELSGRMGQRLQYATEYGYDRGEQTFPAKVAEAAGSAVPFAAAGLAGGALAAGPGAMAASSTLGAGMGSAGMLNEAENLGVTGGRKLAAGAAGAGIGAVEGLLGVESALGKLGASLAGPAKKAIGGEVLKAIAMSGAGESIEEAVQGGLEEVVRDVVLRDPEAEKGLMGWLREAGQSWIDEGLPAFVVGGIMGGMATAAIQRQQAEPERTEDVPVLAGWPMDAEATPPVTEATPDVTTAQEPAGSTQPELVPEVAPVVEPLAGEAVGGDVPPQSARVEEFIAQVEERTKSPQVEIAPGITVAGEQGLFGPQEKQTKPAPQVAPTRVVQPNLLDIQEGDMPGQQTFTETPPEALPPIEPPKEKPGQARVRRTIGQASEGVHGMQAFVRALGGLTQDQDWQGEIRSVSDKEGSKRTQFGLGPLVRKKGSGKGMSLDRVAELMVERGFTTQKLTNQEVFDMIANDAPLARGVESMIAADEEIQRDQAEDFARAEGFENFDAWRAANQELEPAVSSDDDVPFSPLTKANPTAPNVTPTNAPASGTYTQDFEPFTRKPGAFRRTKIDTRKAISNNIARLQAQARATRDGSKSRSADSVYSIIADVSRRFGLGEPGIGGSRTLKRRAAGFYRIGSEGIRLRQASDVRVYLHEVGHHLHKVLFPRYRKSENALPNAKDFPKHWHAELALLGQDLYGATPPKGGYEGEGWAELVHFLFADPAHLKKRAPTLYRDVVETLVREQPDTWLVIQEARIRFEALQKEAETNPIRQHVQRDQKRAPWKSTTDWLMARIVNRNQRLLTMTRDMGTNLPADEDPYTYAQRLSGHMGDDIRRATELGTFDVNDPAKKPTGPSLNQIMAPVKDQIEQWEEYMIAQRILEKRKQGVDARPDVTDKELRSFIESASPEIVEAADKFQTFNEWLVGDYAVSMGLLSEADAKTIIARNKHYITFRHVRANDATGGGGGRSGKSTDKGSGFKRFREGMGEPLHPPLTAFMQHMRSVMVLARENQLGQMLTSPDMMKRAGMARWITKIDRPIEATRIGAEALSKEVMAQLGIKDMGGGQYMLPEGMDESIVDALGMLEDATFFEQGARIDKKNREFTVRREGKPQWYAAQDQQLFDLLEGLYSPASAQSWAELIRIVSMPGRLLRATATEKNPAFFFGNFAADITQAVTLTDELVKQAPARIRGMRQAFLGGDMVELFRASGADMSGLFGEYYDAKNGKIDMAALFGEPKAFGLIKGDSGKAIAKDVLTLGAISRLNNKFELATRLGEFSAVYEAALESGASEREAVARAGQASADITLDFQRGGTWAKEINKVIPFFNAAIQGTDRLARAIKENPARSLGRVAAFVIVPSMIAMLTNWDDEDYWALPMRDRDRYLFFPNGYDDNGRRVWWKVKKPYGLGIFGIAFERSMARMFGINPSSGIREGDPQALEGAGLAILNELRPTLNFAGVQPAIELAAGDRGWSMWRESYIVPATDVGLPTDMQGVGRSSSTARFLGSMLDVAPAKVDYAIGAYLGGLGRMATSTLIDPPLRMLTGEQAGKPMEFEDWLVTLRFSARAPRANHEAIARFFEQYEELQRIDRGFKALEQTNREAAEKYFDEHREALSAWLPYSRTQREMSKHFKTLRGIYRDTEMDPDESARLIEEHYQAVIGLARAASTGQRLTPAPSPELGRR